MKYAYAIGTVTLAALLGLLPSAWAADAKTTANTICVACHGADGNGIGPTFPKLAGQSVEYLTKQLTDYIANKRKNEVMVAIIPTLKTNEVPGLAAYFMSLKPSAVKIENAALAEAGKKIYLEGDAAHGVPGCVGCHGPNGKGDALNARLAGQYQVYLISQLEAFKNGTRNNDKARVMRNAAEHLTDADTKAVAEYLAGQ